MREEQVTINLLTWLERNGWEIICYDFPQSGTGILLHENIEGNRSSKNKGGIIPDILAVRNSVGLFFENKNRFQRSDFEKLRRIKILGNYSDSLNTVLSDFNVTVVYFGIGVPAYGKHVEKSLENIDGIDFLVSTHENGEVKINFDENGIFP